MRHCGRGLLVSALLILFAAGVAAQERSKPAKPTRAASQTAVGCLDQRGETYVLTGDRELKRLLTLEGDGFSDDNFARYLGHKVRVRGRLKDAGSSVFRVREITTVSETCKPEGG